MKTIKVIDFDSILNLIMESMMSQPNLVHVIKSVFAAAIGVQSQKNREIDFENGSLPSYLIVGFIFTIMFIFALIFIVSIVTS